MSLAAIQHEHIVGVVDFMEADGGPWLLMEEVDGPSVRQVLSQRRRLPANVVTRIAADTALALAALHEARDTDGQPLGLVHRDLSPDNLALSSRGVVKLLDFGIVKGTSSPSLTTVGALKGKLPYMAPEQLAVGDVDGRTDLWALGVTVYELLTGVRPFTAPSDLLLMDAILHETPTAPGVLVADVPSTLADLVLWLLEKDPSARPARAGLVADLLENFLGRDRARVSLRSLVAPASPGVGRVATASLSAAVPAGSFLRPGADSSGNDPDSEDEDEDDDLDRTLARARPARGTRTATGVVARAPSSAQPGWWSLVASLVDEDVVAVDEESGVVARVQVLPLVEEETRTVAVSRAPRAPAPPRPPPAPAAATAPLRPMSPTPPPSPTPRSGLRLALALTALTAFGTLTALVVHLITRTPATTVAPHRPSPTTPASTTAAPTPVPTTSASTTPVPTTPAPTTPAPTTPAPAAAPPGDSAAPSPPTASPPISPPSTSTTRPARSPRSGRLTVLAVPFAEVYIDGKRVGVTPIDDLKVDAGRRRLRLVGPNGELKREVVIVAGEGQTLRVAMP